MSDEDLVNSADEAILTSMSKMAKQCTSTSEALVVLRLAEAHAWLRSVNQPHGASAASS